MSKQEHIVIVQSFYKNIKKDKYENPNRIRYFLLPINISLKIIPYSFEFNHVKDLIIYNSGLLVRKENLDNKYQ